DQRRRAAPRDRLADGSGRIGRPHRARQYDRTDRLARADPRGLGETRPSTAARPSLARPLCDGSQRTCRRFGARGRRARRTRRRTGGRHRDRGRERTGQRACRPVPEDLEHRRRGADAVCRAGQLGRSAFAPQVVGAGGKIPRHEFVPLGLQSYAYLNSPLPVGYGKTISQPFIVALMTDLLELQPGDVTLEVGAGVGYQAAILSELVNQVYSIELIEELALDTRKRLKNLGYRNVEIGVGNGYYGWSEHAPFDKIVVTAAPDLIPPPLLAQLKPGGKMVIPTGIP